MLSLIKNNTATSLLEMVGLPNFTHRGPMCSESVGARITSCSESSVPSDSAKTEVVGRVHPLAGIPPVNGIALVSDPGRQILGAADGSNAGVSRRLSWRRCQSVF